MTPSLLELPPEVLARVAVELSVDDVLKVCSTSRRALHAFSCDPVWQELARRNNGLKTAHWRNYMAMSDMHIWVDKGKSCYSYCMQRMDDKRLLNMVVDNIRRWRNGDTKLDELTLEKSTRDIVDHFDRYSHFAMSLRMRLSSWKRFHESDGRFTSNEIDTILKERAANIESIDIAATMCEIAGERMVLNLFRTLICHSDDYISNLTLEEVLVMVSAIDPLFYDLLHVRESVTKTILSLYKAHFDLAATGEQSNEYKVKYLMFLLDHEMSRRLNRKGFHHVEDNNNLQSSLILRAYAGLAQPSQLVYNAIILRFCKLLDIGNVLANEISIALVEQGKTKYIVHTNSGVHVLNSHRADLVGHFPMFADKYVEFISYEETKILVTKESWNRYTFVSVMDEVLCKTHYKDSLMLSQSSSTIHDKEYCSQMPFGINLIPQSRLEKLRGQVLEEMKAYAPTVPSGLFCMHLLQACPKQQKQSTLEPYIPARPCLLGSFKLVPNRAYEVHAKVTRIDFPHLLPFQKGDVVGIRSQERAVVLDYLLPKELSTASIMDKTQLLIDHGYVLLLCDTMYVVVRVPEICEKRDPLSSCAIYNDHAGSFFKSVKNGHFIPNL